MAQKRDLYQDITDKVVKLMETCGADWVKPWRSYTSQGRPKNAKTGANYTGVNVFNFWFDQQDFGYSSNKWATYKQWAELDCQVKKGSKAHYGVYFSTYEKEVETKGGDLETQKIPFLKSFAVFNADQVDGYEKPEPVTILQPLERIEGAEKFVAETSAFIQTGGDRAFYNPTHDFIQLPQLEQFFDTESYYATLLHELTHWTRHKSRLDRDFGRKRWGDAGYAMEELVAELGAALLCGSLQITADPLEDHAKYLNGWLEVLKDDKRAFLSAASQAQKAVDFLEGLQGDNQEAA